MSSSTLTSEQVLTLLAATPPRLTALTTGVAAAQWQTRPHPDEWSANEVLAHLRACADVWGGCIATIIAKDKPTLRAVNPTTWIRQTDYCRQEFPVALRAFATQRTELLADLTPLAPADWARTATVTGAGAVLERTVLFYAQWLARHEQSHVKQLERRMHTPPR